MNEVNVQPTVEPTPEAAKLAAKYALKAETGEYSSQPEAVQEDDSADKPVVLQ